MNMTASSKSVVVWEWMNEYGRWRPYESHIANFIESSHRKNPSVQVNLGKVAPNMGIYSIDFLTMCQIRFGTGTARPVRRQLLADSSPPGKGIIWQWEGDVRGQWNTFDMEVACLLEDHFSNPSTQNTELNLSKTAVKLPYIMDLSKMTQKRIETGRLRMIRRELLAMPYMKCIPSDNNSTGSGSTSAQSNTQSANTGAVNGASCVKKQRLPGRGQPSSNSLSSGTYQNSAVMLQNSKSAMPNNSHVQPQNSNSSFYNFNTSSHSSNTTSHNLNTTSHNLNTTSHSLNAAVYNPNAIAHNLNAMSHNLHTTSHNLNTASQNSNTPQNLNAPSHNLNATSHASNAATHISGVLTRKRLYTQMALSSSLPTSVHINTGTPPVSQQAASQNAQLFHQAHSQSPSHPPPASGISAVGFIPHANMFQRAANFFPGNIGHSSTRPIHPSIRSGLAGGSYGNFTYHSFNNHQMSGPVVRSGVSGAVNPVVSGAHSLTGTQPSTSTGATVGGANGFYLPSEDKIPNNVSKMSTHSSGTWAGCEVFEKYVSILDNPPDDEDCCICCEKLTHASGYGEGKKDEKVVFKLNKCSHMFHKLCILAMYESTTKNGSVQCPTCKTIYGEKHGNCPDGVMEYLTVPHSLPGNEGHQTKVIIYHISPGIQGPEHPHPGKRFSCRGFPRVCYIPDNEKGRKVLKLLTVAWRRRLTFTIGQSSTTGESDTVTWNEIHHKTESGRNDSGHGYPDDKYLDNVLMELNVQGVTEADLSS